MANKKDALMSLVKQLEGTMNAAGLKVADKDVVVAEDGTDVINYTGEAGDVQLQYEAGALSVLATNEEGGKLQTLDTLLFEAESDEWTVKDVRSAANEVADSVSEFFGTTFVTAGASEKSQQKKGNNAKAADAPAPTPKKKKAKKSVDTFEPIDLIYRLEAIFPEFAGKADELEAKYAGNFLPEEYLQENSKMVEDILAAIRTEDRATCKKLFKTFNNYYDDGEKDTQSLIAVTILGMGAAKEEGLLSVMENYASEDLMKVVRNIASYLNTGSGKRALKKFADPKPYKESLKERWGKQGLEQAQGQMLDSSSIKK